MNVETGVAMLRFILTYFPEAHIGMGVQADGTRRVLRVQRGPKRGTVWVHEPEAFPDLWEILPGASHDGICKTRALASAVAELSRSSWEPPHEQPPVPDCPHCGETLPGFMRLDDVCTSCRGGGCAMCFGHGTRHSQEIMNGNGTPI